MSLGQEFWVVATGADEAEKDRLLTTLRSNPAVKGKREAGAWTFAVPDGEKSLVFGSFDNLIRLTDELAKNDSQVDSIVHRLERQYLELDARAEFKIKHQRQERSFMEYLTNWSWDEAKYPRSRPISDNLTLLMSVVNKLDEEARNKTGQYNDFKTQKGNIAKKEGAILTNRDLVDVLTPEVLVGGEADFIYTEHLTTVPVIIARGATEEFKKTYEKFCDNVVPMSAKHFKGLDDKDGNSLWRVVMFKSAAENFKKQCRERKYLARDFEYSEEGYAKLKKQREQIEDQVRRQHDVIRALYQAAWSDAMVAWIHIKAMRVFVESVLRFGVPARFAAFVISPKAGAEKNSRKALADILGRDGSKKMMEVGDEGEDFFPYVSLSLIPFNVQVTK